ncbi:MAG: hypothetical protein LBK62_13985 [Treponema sp.]|jgi:hypothetical protein|nr:hypothetical protein [Treponema sp.]
MCGAKKRFFLSLPLVLLFVSADALRAGEPEWYLISEAELRSIGEYQARSEREKQGWLLQVSELRMRAGKSEADSKLLNSQLSTARERNRTLEQSFNKSEAEHLTAISIKNGEIAELKQTIADRGLEAAAYKGSAGNRLIIIIALAGAWALFIAFKICRFFKVF